MSSHDFLSLHHYLYERPSHATQATVFPVLIDLLPAVQNTILIDPEHKKKTRNVIFSQR